MYVASRQGKLNVRKLRPRRSTPGAARSAAAISSGDLKDRIILNPQLVSITQCVNSFVVPIF
jgi:hypothetical protein